MRDLQEAQLTNQSSPVTAMSAGCSTLTLRENSRFSPGFRLTRQTSFPSSSRVTWLLPSLDSRRRELFAVKG